MQLQREKGLVTTLAREKEFPPWRVFLKVGRGIELFQALAEMTYTLNDSKRAFLFLLLLFVIFFIPSTHCRWELNPYLFSLLPAVRSVQSKQHRNLLRVFPCCDPGK